jgi:3,4-dihydroxy 2-butanone 4-phosphate synthase / GTP cyclohydrolase II
MRLGEWLDRQGMARNVFARRTGLSPASITALCNDPTVWISRETAERIAEATGGAVTPNDFIGLEGKGSAMPDAARQRQEAVRLAIEAFGQGEMLIVTDDDDRENEGDLILAASFSTPEKMAFIIRNTCGIVCAPLSSEGAKRLNLAPMVPSNDAPLGTAFTVSVDVRHGLTTGISAEQRSNTVRALANRNMGASDFVRPGHIFPLVAKDGGVLIRSGHTEAAVDLCKLAGLPPVGVICELANDDGTVMKGDEIARFAEKHALKRISVADLIAYRQAREKLVQRIASFEIDTVIGPLTAHAYVTQFDQVQHVALVHGDLGDGFDVPTRLHRANLIHDVFGKAERLESALKHFKSEGRGVLIYLRDGAVGVPANPLGQPGSDDARMQQWREIGVGAQILKDLGVSSIVNLTSTPMNYVGLSGFGIEIARSDGAQDMARA